VSYISQQGLSPARKRVTFWRVMALAFGCAVVGFGAIVATRQPSNQRPWVPDHAQLPEISIADSLVRIGNLRTFRFRGADDFEPHREAHTYNLNQLTSVWYVLTLFSTSWRGPAHSFVSFGFGDTAFVSISIEARREVGEEYGVLKGIGRNYELIYVIGDERDLIGRRAAFGELDVYLYPIRTSPERARAVFLDMLRRAESLRTSPEFYHTFTNSCISNLVRHVNAVAPGRIPGGLKLLAPGYSDEVALALGLIDSTVSLEVARQRYRINERARRLLDSADFSARIREPR
jgi:hypothetical protein